MSTAARALVTEQEFLALPESMERAELVDGEVIVSPSPGLGHQELLTRFVHALRDWAQGKDVTVVQAPLDVRFAPGRILQPDAIVFAGRLRFDSEGPIEQIPILCVEVLSTNRAHDRVTKRFLYAEAGVREYWIIEPSGVVERRSGDGLGEVREITESLETPVLPGFSLELEPIFRRD